MYNKMSKDPRVNIVRFEKMKNSMDNTWYRYKGRNVYILSRPGVSLMVEFSGNNFR